MKQFFTAIIIVLSLGFIFTMNADAADRHERLQVVLDSTQPLKFPRGDRLPLYLWPAMDLGDVDEAEAERVVKLLDERGVGLVSSWLPGDDQREDSLARALTAARVQTRLGLPVNVNANACHYSFFNGDEKTAHVDDRGKPFWDDSFVPGNKMGCPFALNFRRAAVREQVEYFAKAYKQAGVNLDFVFADWEIDGPLEYNRAWAASKKCARCREHVKNIDDFAAFQKTIRDLRNDLTRDCYSRPVLDLFPHVLVGNYAVYSNNGLRYWYDYFEYFVEGQPHVADQQARYRRWYDEFSGSGYTFAMPVVYTWYPTYSWYDFADSDYRWFYSMLLVASNAGQNTPSETPIISFVHWHTTAPPDKPDPAVEQLSGEKYQELLWHMLLRGHDAFFLWCMPDEAAEEIRLLHPVYAAAQEYGEFLDRGVPVNFDVPKEPSAVVSGLRLGNRVLVRRTDFGKACGPVTLKVGEETLTVPALPGGCQVLTLSQ